MFAGFAASGLELHGRFYVGFEDVVFLSQIILIWDFFLLDRLKLPILIKIVIVFIGYLEQERAIIKEEAYNPITHPIAIPKHPTNITQILHINLILTLLVILQKLLKGLVAAQLPILLVDSSFRLQNYIVLAGEVVDHGL